MAIKSVSIRIEEILEKIGYIADYEGRSVNLLIRENIKAFENENGPIDGDINPDVNVKPQLEKETKNHQFN